MDRQIVYIGQIPQDIDVLLTNKDGYIALAKACAAILGISTLINAFTCSPTGPASMQVVVGPGEIYSLQNIDNTAYGSLASDTTHSIMKQGVNLNSTTLTLTAPSVVGDSWNVLIEVGFSETDGGSTVLPYYNASNPSQAWSGPNNDGQPNNTIRQNQVTVQAKIGVAAPTGTQVTPSPDTGFVGAFVVTIANGQTTITSGNISTYGAAPFITETLTQKISQATADARYVQFAALQSGQYVYGVDSSGSANTLTAALSPAIGSYTAGMTVAIKVANTNTNASTINLNGLGAKNILLTGGGAIAAGDLVANSVALLTYNGTNFELTNSAGLSDFSAANIQNSAYTYAADTGSANAYACALTPAVTSYVAGLFVLLKVTNSNTTASTLNVNSLGTKSIKKCDGTNPTSGDLTAGMVAALIYDGTNFQLLNPNNGVVLAGNGLLKTGQTIAVQRTIRSISTTTTLTSADFEKTIVCTGSAPYTVTLPAQTAGRFIEFVFLPTSNAIVTLAPPSGNIDGQSSLPFVANESCTVYSDGTNSVCLAKKLQRFTCKGYNSATQALANNTVTKIIMDSSVFDTGSILDTGNNRLTPKAPGKWRFNGQLFMFNVASNSTFDVYLYLNGVETINSRFVTINSNNYTIPIDFIQQMNGSTDYVELYMLQISGGSVNSLSGAEGTWLQAERINNF